MIGAVILDSILRSESSVNKPFDKIQLSERYFNLHSLKLESAWDGTKAIDYGFSATMPADGETLSLAAFSARLSDMLFQLSADVTELRFIHTDTDAVRFLLF